MAHGLQHSHADEGSSTQSYLTHFQMKSPPHSNLTFIKNVPMILTASPRNLKPIESPAPILM